MNRTRTLVVPLLLALLVGVGCDTQEQQQDFLDDAFKAPSGFTRIDEDGNIVSEDTDDWRTAPAFLGRVVVQPARPNPTAGTFVTIPVSVREFNAIQGGLRLASLDVTNDFAILDDIPEATDPGAYIFSFNPTSLGRRGLVRVFILDGPGELVSYGDVFVE